MTGSVESPGADAPAAFLAPMVMPAGMNAAEVTLPGLYLCHYITDEQLETLGTMEQEPVREICLAAIGVFFGSLVPALVGLWHFVKATHAVTGGDMLSMLIAFTAAG